MSGRQRIPRLTDEDGIDGPFDRAMEKAIAEDAGQRALEASTAKLVDRVYGPVRSTATIDNIFAATRAQIAVENYSNGWSPAQFCRRAS